MDRLTKDEYGCLLALSASSRSEDYFTQVGGAAMTQDGRIIGLSYNGLKSGMIKPAWMDQEENRVEKGLHMLHAESNLGSLFRRDECHTVYLTISPCISCCSNLAALGIQRVVYINEYHRCNKFKEFFKFYNIEYKELNEQEKINIVNTLSSLTKKLYV